MEFLVCLMVKELSHVLIKTGWFTIKKFLFDFKHFHKHNI